MLIISKVGIISASIPPSHISGMACVNVKDGFTYPEYLERILNSTEVNERVEVINAGIPGAHLKSIVNLLTHEIVKLDPDIIVVNSMYNNLNHSRPVCEKYNISLHQLNQFLLRKSLFYMTLREKISITFHNDIRKAYCLSKKDILKNFENEDYFWLELLEDYKKIAGIAKSLGIKLVIIKQPVSLKEGQGILLEPEFKPIYLKAYDLLDVFTAEDNIVIIDAFGYFDKIQQKDEFFIDGLHLTGKGNELLADFIAQELRGQN